MVGAEMTSAAPEGRWRPSHDGSNLGGRVAVTSARRGSTRCERNMDARGFARRRPRRADAGFFGRSSTTIHARSKRRPVSVSTAASTWTPEQLLTGYIVAR